MIQDCSYVWFDGHLVDRSQATIPAMSVSSQFGITPFEGIRGYLQSAGGLGLFRFVDHVHRLLDSCQRLCIQVDLEINELQRAVAELVIKNAIEGDFAIRILVVVEQCSSWNTLPLIGKVLIVPVTKPRQDIQALTTEQFFHPSFVRIDNLTMPPSVKVGGNYLNGRYGAIEAKDAGVKHPVFLTRDGFVSETGGANIFAVFGDRLITPPEDDFILRGITRDTLLAIAPRLGLAPCVERIHCELLCAADEVFLCGSAVELQPIVNTNRQKMGQPQTTKDLLDLYLNVVSGEVEIDRNWITSVS